MCLSGICEVLPTGHQIDVMRNCPKPCGNKALLTAVWSRPSWLSAHGHEPQPALCRSMTCYSFVPLLTCLNWLQGDLIQDSHAEVIARRALQHWLHAELLLCLRSRRAPQLKPPGSDPPLSAPADAARQILPPCKRSTLCSSGLHACLLGKHCR